MSFLSNPFIIKTPEGFRGRVLLATPASHKDMQIVRRYQTRGINGIDIFCALGINNDVKNVNDQYYPNKIYDISNLTHPLDEFCSFRIKKLCRKSTNNI